MDSGYDFRDRWAINQHIEVEDEVIFDFVASIADPSLKNHFTPVAIQRSIVDGQRGYTVTHISGVRGFYFRLGDAFRAILSDLDHASDREIMVIGEPEEGNVW